MAVAPEKIEKIHYLLTTILGSMTPAEQEGFLNRYGDPLFPIPPDEAKIDAFIGQFGAMLVGKTPDEITKEINRKELRSMVDTYEREAGKIADVGKKAERRGKATVQELMQRALEAPVPAEEKGRLLQILEDKSERQTDKTIPELTSEAVEVIAVKQASAPVPAATKAEVFKFSNLKDLKPLQKALAPLADAVTTVFPDFRAGVINVVLAETLDKAVKNVDKITKLFGGNVVNDPWFKKLHNDAQALTTQGAKPGGAQSVVDDVFISLFRGAAEPTVTAYIELYRINYLRGEPTPSINQMQAAGLGWGSTVRAGVNIGVGAAKSAGVKWLAARAGLALVPGPGWAASLLAIGGGLLGRVAGWFKSLTGIKGGLVPGDKEIIAVGCGSILLIFFILPFMSQLIIDSALVGRLATGGGGTQNGTAPGSPGSQPGSGGLPPYPGAPTIPGDISGCPTKSAYVISSCPTWSGHVKYGECAYDITGMADGTPVLATHDGVVAVRSSGSTGYGNWIELKGQAPGGETYYTIYGHLMAFNVQQGQQVRAGQIIGYIDNTGNSSGTHLHYELRSSTNAVMPDCGKQFLPAACVTNPWSCNIK